MLPDQDRPDAADPRDLPTLFSGFLPRRLLRFYSFKKIFNLTRASSRATSSVLHFKTQLYFMIFARSSSRCSSSATSSTQYQVPQRRGEAAD